MFLFQTIQQLRLYLSLQKSFMRDHHNPPLPIVSSCQECPSIRCCTNGKGQRAVDQNLRGYQPASEVKI